MATRKIKDAKDTTTNEVIYFKGHAKATYMSDGRSVEDAIYSIGSSGGEGGITQESDPLFRASAAAGITSSDIAAWNGKMDKVTLASVATSGNYNDLSNKPTIPTTLSQLTQSASYRTVTDTEKSTWNAKLDKNTADNSYLGKNEKAASAINDGNGNNISNTYATKTALSEGLAGKQDTITDLAAIRSGAKLGETALREHQDISGKVDKVEGKQLSTEDFTTTEKNKLAGIEDNANDYIHPDDGEGAMGSYAASNPTSLEGAEKITIPTFTVNKLGHMTSAGTNEVTVPDFSKFAKSIQRDDLVAGVIDGVVDISSFFSNLQAKLVSGRTIKTINGEDILGSGDIAISSGGLSQETDPIFSASPAAGITEENITDWDSKQDAINDIATIRENAGRAFKGTINGYNNGTLWLVAKVNGQTADSTGNVSVPVAYPKVAHGTNDATFTLIPNVFHVWGGMGALTLTLGAETDGVANEYLFQFTGGSGGTTLVLPDSVKWADGAAPTIEAFKTYQVSILENCATYLCFE